MPLLELPIRPENLRPRFGEYILALPDLPSDEVQSQLRMRQLVISAADLGRRSLDHFVFVGLGGELATTKGTFDISKDRNIEGMTSREWQIAAQGGSTEGMPFGTPAEEAIIYSGLPTVAAIDRNRLEPSEEPDGLHWYLVKEKSSDPEPKFEDAVVSAVYIPHTFDEISALQRRLGLPSNHIFDGYSERWGLGSKRKAVLTKAQSNMPFTRPSLYLVR